MKRVLIGLAILAIASSTFYLIGSNHSNHYHKCSGGHCTTCRTCAKCQHCNQDGGSCSVCADRR